MNIWNDHRELVLLIVAIASFIMLCVVEVRVTVLSAFEGTILGAFLIADATKNIVSGLLIGILSAYIFYLLIDYLPRARREQKTIEVLNSLLASVLDAYKRCRIFGHETPLSHVDKSVLEKDWIEEQMSLLKANKSNFLPLKYAMQTAYTRIEDFRHTLPLAVGLSPEHAMQWLIIIDKVRLLAENYGEQPPMPKDKLRFIDKDTDENPIRNYKNTLNQRLLEIVEQSQNWLYPKRESNG